MISYFAPHDTERLRQIRMEALTSDPDAFGETAESFAQRSNQELTDWLSDAARADRKAIGYVEHNGVPVAMCGFGISDEDASTGFLWGLFVSRPHRRRGIARMMLEDAEAWLSARGVTIIRAAVAAPNEDAIEFYRACKYCVGPPIGTLRPTSSIPLHEITKDVRAEQFE